MDLVLKVLFGSDVDTPRGQHDAFGSAFDGAHRAMLRYVMTTVPINALIGKLPWPFGGWVETGGITERLVRSLHPSGRKFDAMVVAVHAEASKLIQSCRSDPLLAQRSGVLAAFLNSRTNEVPLTHPMHADMLRNMVMNFVLAGRDTTACTATWIFFALATQPEVQTKLIEEIDAVLGGNVTNVALSILGVGLQQHTPNCSFVGSGA